MTLQAVDSRGTRADGNAARSVPLAMDAAGFRETGHALVDMIAEFLESVPDRRVAPDSSPEGVRRLMHGSEPLPHDGAEPSQILRETADLLFDNSLFNAHPRFFGYITSSPAPIGMLGDLLASAVNANVGAWRLAPVASEIEAQAVRWIAELIGCSHEGGGGLFVSGGNMANMVGLFAARAAAADWNVRSQGLAAKDSRPLRVYASAETHTWIQKAADLSGIGTDSIRWIPADADLRMDMTSLRQAMTRDAASGDRPLMVVGTAGSVSTGAIDPLFDIAETCREMGAWFHVDGAYGALAAAAAGTPRDLEALHLADSVAVDPHKWLYAPLEAGCVLVRDANTLRAAFAYHPPYYHFGEEATNYTDFGPQNSRGFRALKVWLALRQAGRTGYERMIGDDIRLSERLWQHVQDHPELEPVTQALSITTFRFVPHDLTERTGGSTGDEATEAYLNRLNEELLEHIQRSGELFVSNAVVHGRYVLRACIVNFNTTAADIDALPDIIVRMGREVAAKLEV